MKKAEITDFIRRGKGLIILSGAILVSLVVISLVMFGSRGTEEKREEKEVTDQPTIININIRKEIISKKTVPKEKVASKESAKKTVAKKTKPKETVAKKTVSKKVAPEEAISEEITLKKKVSKEIIPEKPKRFSLSLEEEKFLVEELKKHLYPISEKEEKKLFGIIELLRESGSLSKYNNLLCVIVEENLNHEIFGALISEKAICYLAKIGSAKSIQTLLWAFVNTDDAFERKIIKKVIKAIKEGKRIDLKPLFSDKFIYSKDYNKAKRSHRPRAFRRIQ